jgi:predicted  nucleic acid-binding Zn-ribbon protein
MRKLILIPILLLACSKGSVETKEMLIDSMAATSSDTITALEKTEHILHETEGLEEKIEQTYKTKETLEKENSTLKQELKVTKDSLVSKEYQLKYTIKRMPKKKNLIEKVFNIGPDSIEIKN